MHRRRRRLLIAAAMLVPGDRTRGRALVENGRRAMKLIAASTLFLIVAGSLEGMVSPIPNTGRSGES